LAKHKEKINSSVVDDADLKIDVDYESEVERLRVVGEHTDTPNKIQASPKGISSMSVMKFVDQKPK
jgi:hypothetical protein